MDAKQLIEARQRAEKAVSEMPDGDLKVKAFEVILSHLLGATTPKESKAPEPEPVISKKGKSRKKSSGSPQKATASGRILVLRDEGFFKTQRTIGQTREELAAHGWHYPVTSLSGTMQSLVQQQELRRVRVTEGKKKIWKYSNW